MVILQVFKIEGFTTLPLLKGNFVREIEMKREEKERNITDDERKLQWLISHDPVYRSKDNLVSYDKGIAQNFQIKEW